MPTHKFETVLTVGNDTPIKSTETVTFEKEEKFDLSVANPTTDLAIALAFTAAKVKSVYLLSTQDVTLETNSGSSPTDTIALKAGSAIKWKSGGSGSNPFTANVTGLFVTNASGAAAQITIRIGIDPR